MLLRALKFAVVFGAFEIIWQPFGIRNILVEKGIVAPLALIARVLTPQLDIRVYGHLLWEPRGGLNIVSGCDGTAALFLLLAAFAVAPISWRGRIWGALAGIPIVYLLNCIRILTLFYAHRADLKLFDVMHVIVTPILMALAIAAFCYAWFHRWQPAATA